MEPLKRLQMQEYEEKVIESGLINKWLSNNKHNL